MASISDHSTFFREGFKGVSRYEKRRLDVVFGKKLQHSPHADRAGKHACDMLGEFLYDLLTDDKDCAHLGKYRSLSLRRRKNLASRQRHQCPRKYSKALLEIRKLSEVLQVGPFALTLRHDCFVIGCLFSFNPAGLENSYTS